MFEYNTKEYNTKEFLMDKRFKYITSSRDLIAECECSEINVEITKGSYKEPDKINFNIDVTNPCYMTFSLLDVLGGVVFFVKEYCDRGINKVKVCTRELRKGYYYLEIITGEKSFVKQILID